MGLRKGNWDLEAIRKRMEERQKETRERSERGRQELIEQTRLSAQAREAARAGGLEGWSDWAMRLGVDVGSPAPRRESGGARALRAAREALGLGGGSAEAQRQKRLIELTERIAREDYARESRHEAIKDQLRLRARLAELKDKERQVKEARAASAEASLRKAPAEADPSGGRAPKRKILGGRGPG